MEQLLTIDIDTNDKQLATVLMNGDSEPKVGATIRINDDLSLRFEGRYLRKLGDHPDTISLLVSIQSDAVISSLVNFLFDRIEKNASALRINRKDVMLERKAVSKAIAVELD